MSRVSPWKWALVLALILIAFYQIYPSIPWYQLPSHDRYQIENDRTRQLAAERAEIKANLDQIALSAEERERAETKHEAGEQLTPEEENYVTLVKDQRAKIRESEEERNHLIWLQDESIKLGLDLVGGMYLILEVDTSQFDHDEQKSQAVDGVIEKIRNRVDQLGVKEPVIQKQGLNQIVVQLPGIADTNRVEKIIGKTAKLRFQLVAEDSAQQVMSILEGLDETEGYDLESKAMVIGEEALHQDTVIDEEQVDYFQRCLFDLETGEMLGPVGDIVPSGYVLAVGNPQKDQDIKRGSPHRRIYLLRTDVPLTGDELTDAYMQFDSGGLQRGAYVSLEFDGAGTRTFKKVTTEYEKKARMAIVLDRTVYSAPFIREKIPYGKAQITGNFTTQEARDLAVVLKAGALPADARVIRVWGVDPLLGQDSINRGMRAAVIGASVVLLFMVAYYLLCGVIADIALLFNLMLLMACLALFGATLTLPGIGGVILFIGMAVDANVLIYERIREEVAAKKERAISLSVDKGYSRAFTTIVDANVTTLITALVLFQFGTGPVRGFAVTLTLGILISMFTAIVVTRIMVDFWTNNLRRKTLPIGSMRVLSGLNINFLKFRKVAFAASGVILVVGMVFFLRNDIFGVELSEGTLLELGFSKEIQPAEIRSALAQLEISSEPRVQRARALGKHTGRAEFEFIVRYKEPIFFEMRTAEEGEAGTVRQEGTVVPIQQLERAFQAVSPGNSVALIRQDSVGPQISANLRTKAIQAIVYSTVLIMMYISVRFQFKFAVGAVAALFHDVLISVALFSIARAAGLNVEINLAEVAALLTIFGYSINDTIVVFDRIRENLRPGRVSFQEVVNHSINQTLSRTAITSTTTMFTVLSLLILGGSVIFDFALILLFGVIVGTYSSIFIASPVIVMWESWRGRGVQVPSPVRAR